MQTLHTQQNGSIATPAHTPSEPKTIKSHNIETKIIETKVSTNCSFEDALRSKSKQAIAQALFSFSPPINKNPIVSSVSVSSNYSSSTRCLVPPDETRSATFTGKSQTHNTAQRSAQYCPNTLRTILPKHNTAQHSDQSFRQDRRFSQHF